MNNLEDITESLDFAKWIVENHTPVNPKEMRTRCLVCDSWYPCDLIGLAALALLERREIESLKRALPDPGKLWALAVWIDSMYPKDKNPEVQNDLRAWSRAITSLDPKKYGSFGVPEIVIDTPND